MTKGDLRWIKNWQPQQIGNNMNRFYRKPKPETMKKNRETYAKLYPNEIKWLSDNFDKIQKHNKFLLDMCMILKTGGRKITPKMANAMMDGIKRCQNNPRFNPVLQTEAEAKLKPIMEKIAMVEKLAESKNDKALGFIQNVKEYVTSMALIYQK